MSYIRCLSNPEGLYIWGSDKKTNEVYISLGVEKLKVLSLSDFNKIIKKFNNYEEDGNEMYKSGKIKLEYIKVGKDFKYRLSCGKWHIDMWEVTWQYICRTRV